MSASSRAGRTEACSPIRISRRSSRRCPPRSMPSAACARTPPWIVRSRRSIATQAQKWWPIGFCWNFEGYRGQPAVTPIVAITAGDPAGIGPEIARKAADDPRVRAVCEPVIYGPPAASQFEPGILSAEAGRAAYDAICAAVRDALDGRVSAIATAPVNKLGFSRAGLHWKGHTDLLADLTHASRVAMMFWSEPLKVVLATVHVPLAEVPRLLTRALLGDIIDLTARELPRFGIARPRLALAGLNPHAGEEGLLGSEETQVLRPAVEDARSRGIAIDGPFPGDTIF